MRDSREDRLDGAIGDRPLSAKHRAIFPELLCRVLKLKRYVIGSAMLSG
jgi:hypothetical protein